MRAIIEKYFSSDKYGTDEYGTNAQKVVEESKKLERGFKLVAELQRSFSDSIVDWVASYPSNEDLFSLATRFNEVSLHWIKSQEEFVEYIARVRHEFEILSAYFAAKSDYQRNFDLARKDYLRLEAKKNKGDLVWCENNKDRIRKSEMMKDKRARELEAYMSGREQNVKIKAKRIFTILGSGHMRLGRDAFQLFGNLHTHLNTVYPFKVSEYTAVIHNPILLALGDDTLNIGSPLMIDNGPTISEPTTPCVSVGTNPPSALSAQVVKESDKRTISASTPIPSPKPVVKANEAKQNSEAKSDKGNEVKEKPESNARGKSRSKGSAKTNSAASTKTLTPSPKIGEKATDSKQNSKSSIKKDDSEDSESADKFYSIAKALSDARNKTPAAASSAAAVASNLSAAGKAWKSISGVSPNTEAKTNGSKQTSSSTIKANEEPEVKDRSEESMQRGKSRTSSLGQIYEQAHSKETDKRSPINVRMTDIGKPSPNVALESPNDDCQVMSATDSKGKDISRDTSASSTLSTPKPSPTVNALQQGM